MGDWLSSAMACCKASDGSALGREVALDARERWAGWAGPILAQQLVLGLAADAATTATSPVRSWQEIVLSQVRNRPPVANSSMPVECVGQGWPASSCLAAAPKKAPAHALMALVSTMRLAQATAGTGPVAMDLAPRHCRIRLCTTAAPCRRQTCK